MKLRVPYLARANRLSSLSALSKDFFLRATITVARDLLGKGLFVQREKQSYLVQLTEVEAYLGSEDPASHAYRGKTKRNWPMFEIGGTCYVYLSYGVHYCMNVVTGKNGQGGAILLRSAGPLIGIEKMGNNRGIHHSAHPKRHPSTHLDGSDWNQTYLKKLLSGPGKLTQALRIDLRHNGLLLNQPNFKLVDLGCPIAPKAIGHSPRIGISQARSKKLRFSIKNSPWLSRKEGTLVPRPRP